MNKARKKELQEVLDQAAEACDYREEAVSNLEETLDNIGGAIGG